MDRKQRVNAKGKGLTLGRLWVIWGYSYKQAVKFICLLMTVVDASREFQTQRIFNENSCNLLTLSKGCRTGLDGKSH